MSLIDWFTNADMEMHKSKQINFNDEVLTIETTYINQSERWKAMIVNRSKNPYGGRDSLEKAKDYNNLEELIVTAIHEAYDEEVTVDESTINEIKDVFEK